ncbi:hypothetical protein C4559_03685 [Candidatus Microgenomates bacterium]|nr:MAG: hypothetical protein C4559_03685 [Candidatus Microgenomates bacterium]
MLEFLLSRNEPASAHSKAQAKVYESTKAALWAEGLFSTLHSPLSEVDRISYHIPTSVDYYGSRNVYTLFNDPAAPFGKTAAIKEKHFHEKHESEGLNATCTLNLRFSRENQIIPQTFAYMRLDHSSDSSFQGGFTLEGGWKDPDKFRVYLLDPNRLDHTPETQAVAKLAVEDLIDRMFIGRNANDVRSILYSDIPANIPFKEVVLKLSDQDKNLYLTFLGYIRQKTIFIRKSDGFFGIRGNTDRGIQRESYTGFGSGTIDFAPLANFFSKSIAACPNLDIPKHPYPPVQKESPAIIIPNLANR